jgi:hypothetical protein
MKIKDLQEGMIFKIINKDNAETTITEGKISDIWSMRAGKGWGIQFDDELQTFTWGNDEDNLPEGFEYIGDFNANEFRR